MSYTMGTSNGRSRRAVVVTLVVGFPFSAVFLWLSRPRHRPRRRRRTIDGGRPVPLVANGGVIAVMYWFQAIRWRRIAGRLPRRSVYAMLVAGLAVNNVVPGRLGDFLRANWMARATRVPGGRGLATVVLDRGGDLVVLAAALFVCLPFVTHAAWVDRLVVGAAVGRHCVFVIVVVAAHGTRGDAGREGRGAPRSRPPGCP